jgi:hypothetical protein
VLTTTVIIGKQDSPFPPNETYDRSLFLVKPNPVAGQLYFMIVNPGNGYQFASVGSNHFIELRDKDVHL